MTAHNLKKAIGAIAIAGAIAGTMSIGDAVGLNRAVSRAYSKIAGQETKIAQGFYTKPYELNLVIEKNETGGIESYLSTKDKRYQIYQGQEGVLVGDLEDIAKNMDSSQQETIFKEFPETEQKTIITTYMKDKVADGIDQGKNFLKDLYDKISGYFEKP